MIERFWPTDEPPYIIDNPAFKSLDYLKAFAEFRILGSEDPIEVKIFRRNKGLIHMHSDNGLGYIQKMYWHGDNPEILVDELARKMRTGKRVEVWPSKQLLNPLLHLLEE